MITRKPLTISLEIKLIEQLNKERGDVPLSLYINNLLKRAIKMKGGEKR